MSGEAEAQAKTEAVAVKPASFSLLQLSVWTKRKKRRREEKERRGKKKKKEEREGRSCAASVQGQRVAGLGGEKREDGRRDQKKGEEKRGGREEQRRGRRRGEWAVARDTRKGKKEERK
ncbi:hypothetical protein M9H77_22942 [Catharanthus roseus]|uniref:Uncharacterized protein n=1 Tax=Catharanthus roseus TaxID=4058 RepID=A0ACC0ASV2_CATRO|nr:hypothetical protein M9H77_22942 [Catharanthus roseus]